MKELKEIRKTIKAEHSKATNQVRLETQRQKRLVEKASRLSNEDLLEVFHQRHENQAAYKAKCKAKAKAKAKPVNTTD